MKVVYQLLLVLGFIAILAACDDTPPTPATVAELCTTIESNTVVEVQGHFGLPLAMTCQEGECHINFGNGEDGIMATVRAGDQPRENMMQYPPEQYRLDDLILVMDDGAMADHNTTLLVRGRVRQPSANNCYLDVHSLQRP